MVIRSRASTPISLLVLAGLLVPAIADARSWQRRNYADEWRQDAEQEEWREEQEKARQDWQEHEAEQQQRYLDHDEKQLDTVLDFYSGAHEPTPPKKGGACIYGPDNQVLHQPDGVVCDAK